MAELIKISFLLPNGCYNAGEVASFPEKYAHELIRRRYARAVVSDAPVQKSLPTLEASTQAKYLEPVAEPETLAAKLGPVEDRSPNQSVVEQVKEKLRGSPKKQKK